MDQKIDKGDTLVPCLYKIGKCLGMGGFGTVHECQHIETGLLFAVKIYSEETPAKGLKAIERELDIMEKLKNVEGNFVKIVDIFYVEKVLHVVMDLVVYGDMGMWKEENGYIKEAGMMKIIHQLLQAVAICHENNIVHRDIKLDNILIEEMLDLNDGEVEPVKVLLCDFGLATTLRKGKKLTGREGTSGYQAPEVFTGNGYGFGVDMWSVGVCASLLTMGQLPFGKESDSEEYLDDCHGHLQLACSETVETFIRRCLTVDPVERWTAREALQYHAFAGFPEFSESSERLEYRRQCASIKTMQGATCDWPEVMSVDEE